MKIGQNRLKRRNRAQEKAQDIYRHRDLFVHTFKSPIKYTKLDVNTQRTCSLKREEGGRMGRGREGEKEEEEEEKIKSKSPDNSMR